MLEREPVEAPQPEQGRTVVLEMQQQEVILTEQAAVFLHKEVQEILRGPIDLIQMEEVLEQVAGQQDLLIRIGLEVMVWISLIQLDVPQPCIRTGVREAVILLIIRIPS